MNFPTAQSLLRSWVNVEEEADAIRFRDDPKHSDQKVSRLLRSPQNAADPRREKAHGHQNEVKRREGGRHRHTPTTTPKQVHDDCEVDEFLLEQARKELREQTHQYCLQLHQQEEGEASEERRAAIEQKRQEHAAESARLQRERHDKICKAVRILSAIESRRRNDGSTHRLGWMGLLPPWLHPHRRRTTQVARQQLRCARDARRRARAFAPWRDVVEQAKKSACEESLAREAESLAWAEAHYAAWRCRSCFRHWRVTMGERVHEEARMRLKESTLRFVTARGKDRCPDPTDHAETLDAVDILNRIPTPAMGSARVNMECVPSSSSANPWTRDTVEPVELPGSSNPWGSDRAEPPNAGDRVVVSDAGVCGEGVRVEPPSGAALPTAKSAPRFCPPSRNRSRPPRASPKGAPPAAAKVARTKGRQPWDPRPKHTSRLSTERECPPDSDNSVRPATPAHSATADPVPQCVLDMERRAKERRERHQAVLDLKEKKRLDALREEEEEEERLRVEEAERIQAERAHHEHIHQMRLQFCAQIRAATTHYSTHLMHHAFVAFLRLHAQCAKSAAVAVEHRTALLWSRVWRQWREHVALEIAGKAKLAEEWEVKADGHYARITLRCVWGWIKWATIVDRDGMQQRNRVGMLKLKRTLLAWHAVAEDCALAQAFRARELHCTWISRRSFQQWQQCIEDAKLARHKELLWEKVHGWLKDM